MGGNFPPDADDLVLMDPSEHQPWFDLASAAADGELSGSEQRMFDEHALQCEDCQGVLARFETMRRQCLIGVAPDLSERGDQILAAVIQQRSPARVLVRRAAIAGAVACAVLAMVMVGGGRARPAAPTSEMAAVSTIHATSHGFDHPTVEVPVGSTVEWENVGHDEHLLVRSIDGTTVRTPLDPGGSQQVTFDRPGVYRVHCEIHPSMVGTVKGRRVRRARSDRLSSASLRSADLSTLAIRAGLGDAAATSAFVERTLPDVWRFCSHVLDADRADDATQATYLRALGSIHNYRGESSAKTWLIGVAHHVCLDEMRSRHRRTRLVERMTAQPQHGIDAQDVGAIDLHRSIRALGPDRREAFVLTQVLGFSYEETATIVGCPVGTVRSRVARARTDLMPAAISVEGSLRSARS